MYANYLIPGSLTDHPEELDHTFYSKLNQTVIDMKFTGF